MLVRPDRREAYRKLLRREIGRVSKEIEGLARKAERSADDLAARHLSTARRIVDAAGSRVGSGQE